MTKAFERLLYLVVLVALALAACAPKPLVTPTTGSQATELPATQASSSETATKPPVLVTVTVTLAAQVQPSPTLVTIDLSGPPMEVGSTFMYVDGSTLVAVPKGEFIMGHGGEDDPVHTVSLDDFWIYRTEVSNRQYALCVAMGICPSPDPKLDPYFDPKLNPKYFDPTHANDPVVGVNWDQADAYCKMVKGRLPTEAEWEKTARGPDGNIYPWGKANPSCDLANIGRCNPTVTKVNGYPQGKSYYDALNMAGNVFEWMGDWYSLNYYSLSPKENPLGPETGTFRSVRSASYTQDSYLAESARRFRNKPTDVRDDLGFRCVVVDPFLFAPWCQQVAYVGADQGGGAPGDVIVPAPNCPNVGVTSAGYCNTNVNPKVPAASVNFSPDSPPPGTIIDFPASCTLDLTTADPNDYYCTGSGTASIQAQCTVPPPPVPAGCPAGYTQNGNVCEYTGGGTGATQCLPGVTYNPATQCCGSTPGLSDSFTICPASAPYYSGGVCVPWPSSDTGPLVTVVVSLGSCGTGDNNNNGGIDLKKKNWKIGL
jgi:formylglycine-generating enzyme required for sulfatase activity